MSNIAVTTFNGGVFTPQIDASKQISKYTSGCRRLDNMIPDLYGNATRRPGTVLIAISNEDGTYV